MNSLKSIQRTLCLLAIMATGNYCATAQVAEIQELQIALGQQSYAAPAKNKSVSGEPISIAGVPYKKGVGVHATSNLRLRLNNSRRFTAKVGVNDNAIDYGMNTIKSVPLLDGKQVFYNIVRSSKQFLGVEGSERGSLDKGSVIFRLVHNNEEIFNSGLMRQGDKAKEIDVKIGGGVLEMIVEDAGDGVSGDHAVWVDPIIEYFEIGPAIAEADYLGEKLELPEDISRRLQEKIEALPLAKMPLPRPDYDWLIDNEQAKAEVYKTANKKEVVISNGLISRVFRVVPNLATIDYVNQMTGESILRAVSNEGTVVIDGKEYAIGGLTKQPEYGYTMTKWIEQMSIDPKAFIVSDFEVKPITDRIQWKQVRWASNKKMPEGKEIVFTLMKNGIEAKVHIELYDGLPTLSKWMEFTNKSNLLVQINSFKLEQLAMVEGENLVGTPKHWKKPNIHIETDFAFPGMQQRNADRTTYWEKDPRYTSQTNYPLNLPCMLEVRPPLGPETGIDVNETLTTFRVWETPMDTRDEERRGLFIRKMYRTISPWATENPIFLHLVSTDPKVVRNAIDQCAETGYEMIILSFGSGLNMEDESEENYAKFRKLREYANSKGIELGGYSLLGSRWISEEVDIINPITGKRGGNHPGFSSPCVCSDWGYDYVRKIKRFFTETGMQVFENDGSYAGQVCASTKHAHHNGLGDSQWKQYFKIQGMYQWMRAEGIYMNVPVFYMNSGVNKTGIGYREVNWSLPRERQTVLGRTNIYDAMWTSIPSMCWTFVPLTQYHGGGAAATMEPLKDHLRDYENHMVQNYGSGVQACYRGPRLYDAPETKELVINSIQWYKKYRQILNGDIIHLKRPNGKDWDGILHVDPKLKEKGFLMVYNPTEEDMVREIKLPLYYTGLTQKASIREKEGKPQTYTLDREYSIKMTVVIPANSYNWYVIQ